MTALSSLARLSDQTWSELLVVRTCDGAVATWDRVRYGWTVRDNGNLLIQKAGPAAEEAVAVFAAGQWIAVFDGQAIA